MDFVGEYAAYSVQILNQIWENEAERIKEAGSYVADSLANDGLLYAFGCGHSHMIEEELFYRAGGLAAVYPMFDTSTMLHEGAAKSSQIERMSGYADKVIARYPITEKDTVLLASTSGINSFIIEFAQHARNTGAKVIGITSYAYLKKPSRHKDGLHLYDVCNLAIDNHVPSGDATVTVCEDGTKAGPISSVATLAICDAIELAACQSLRKRGLDPEVFRSGNVEGSDEYNGRLIKKYQGRIRSL